MQSLLLVTKQLRLAADVSQLALQDEYFVNSVSDDEDIEIMAKKDNVFAVIIDLSIFDDFNHVKRLIEQVTKTFSGPIVTFDDKYDDRKERDCFELGVNDYFSDYVDAQRIMLRTLKRVKIYDEIMEDTDKAKRKEHFKDFEISLKHFQVKYHGEVLNFTPKEFNIFYYLIRHHDQVLSREQIFNGVWREDRDDGDSFISSRIVDMHVSHVRDKLKDLPGNDVEIKTVRGFGYVLQ
ncbi:Alkaline phosphatase synthesis transcriptional regulatory protein PhoP [Apilactobacillus kunkeei]|nr:Alkaline phosphatase synthesis transcriptional regulatory protein PhoP [Apilactobacillus kunkeei]CAI2626488.1 Alkaline phosphatase synthesis transcriptional regulatory protein PhoP [Apilactobacillus kunkeei]CAI2631542.1 Alkaline phosphatase synthesis transcriptional regulatory protein PhoP [Apilactobacillus kunkeei]